MGNRINHHSKRRLETLRMVNNQSETERRLWATSDEFRANPELKSSEYATPVLGLIFLRYADHRFTIAEKDLVGCALQNDCQNVSKA